MVNMACELRRLAIMKLARLTTLCVSLAVTLVTAPSSSHSEDLFFTYYNNWCQGSDNQWSLGTAYYISTKTFAHNIGNVTHVIVFMGYEIVKDDHVPYFSVTKQYADNGGGSRDSLDLLWNGSGNPGGGYSDWVSRGGIEALRDSLHAKGKFILIDLQAVNASVGLNSVVADSAKTEVFSRAVWAYIGRHNFDGADLNVENSQTYTRAQFLRFHRIMARNKPAGKLYTVVPPVTQSSDYAGAQTYIDYVLPQCYSYVSNWQSTATCSGAAGNGVFLKAPLHRNPNPSGSNHQDLTTWGPNQWYAAGWPKSKIVILLSNEANPFMGTNVQFGCAGWNTPFWPDTAAYAMLSRGGTLVWDDVHIGAYVKGTATQSLSTNGTQISSGQQFIIPILSDRNIDSVVAWGKASGYSNYGLYDVSTDARTPAAVKIPRHARLSSLLNPGPPPPPAPTGSLTASPSSLPEGGGNVTLSWTSANADSARLSPGVGAVPFSGSTQVTVSATTTFTLTLSNRGTRSQYFATVVVALPGGQGHHDITIEALSPIALITQPTGNGNRNIEIIRDGDTPPMGSLDPTRQFDTYNGGAGRPLDWIGYSFPMQHTFSALSFQEGIHSASGGWFTSLSVQVRVNGTWTDVQSLQSNPPYAGNDGVNYETYELSFTPTSGDGIRIAGTPGGSAYFISLGELRVYDNVSTDVPPGPGTPRKFSLEQNYPNPFNPTTKIEFSLPSNDRVTLKVYNLLGEEVALLFDGFMEAGRHRVDFSGEHLPNGTYFYILKTSEHAELKKMILLK